MAVRRRLPTMGYGAPNIPTARGGNAPLPPPPDGSIPNRLPVGVDPNQAAPDDPNMMQMQGGGGGDDTDANPMQAMLRLLEQANRK